MCKYCPYICCTLVASYYVVCCSLMGHSLCKEYYDEHMKIRQEYDEIAEDGINQRTGMLKSNADLKLSYSEQEVQFLNTAQAVVTTGEAMDDAVISEQSMATEMAIVTEELNNQQLAYDVLAESMTKNIREALINIQNEIITDPFGWVMPVD